MKNNSNYSPKIIRLTENNLVKIIEKVILESKKDLLNKNAKITYSEFVKKAKQIHKKPSYIYPPNDAIEWEGIGQTKPIKINCPLHDDFYCTPSSHIDDKVRCKCLKCVSDSYNEFIEKAKKIHQHPPYFYLVENLDIWKGIQKTGQIKVKCPYHEIFEITPHKHIYKKSGCPKCRQKEDFMEKVQMYQSNPDETLKYTGYDKIELSDKNLNNCNKIELFCPVKANNFPDGNLNNFEEEPHGYFTVSPSTHVDLVKKRGCPKCLNAEGKNIKDDKFTWLDKIIKKNKSFLKNGKLIYDYTDTVYEDAKTMVDVICPKHGPWDVRASSHLHDESGCPKCEESRGELSTTKYFEDNKITSKRQKVFDGCKGRPNPKGTCRPLKFDFYLEDLNTAIEIDGRYHFEEIKGNDLKSQIINDKIKNDFINSGTNAPEKLIRIEYKSNNSEKLIENLEKLLKEIKPMEKGTILLSDNYPKKGWNDPNNV